MSVLFSYLLIPYIISMFLAMNMGGSGTAPAFSAAYGSNILRKSLIPGSFGIMVLIAILTSISIIAFSLILAAICKTVNEVLIIGNFPLFLFMFFTGAAFPLEGKALFHIAEYPISLQGFMSPTHSISALKKVLIMEMNMQDIFPELLSIIVLTIIYFVIGVWAFKRRHMKVE